MYSKELFKDFEFPVGKFREDEFSTYKFWFKVNRVYYTPYKLYYYYQRSDSILHQENVKKEMDYWDALIERHDFFVKMKMQESFLVKDIDFCTKQLYNVFFLKGDSRKSLYSYEKKYKCMYDQIKIKQIDKYFCARYLTFIFKLLWKIKVFFRNNIILKKRSNLWLF